ncbi:NAD(P)H-binding protein [Embleya sp. NPDC005971]|uniref:SDR family oxidoreductase n=1 Tax=Embleya sp. NPDC005971 TaxID=3156724 RepID=UPI0034012BA8
MRILIAGSTGVLGRRVVPALVAAGHRVTALTRRPEASTDLRAHGVQVASADVYDREALTRVVSRAEPDVVMHQLTDLSAVDLVANARMRAVGTRNLVDAAQEAGVRRIVAQSIAWAYEAGEGTARARWHHVRGPLVRWARGPRPPAAVLAHTRSRLTRPRRAVNASALPGGEFGRNTRCPG